MTGLGLAVAIPAVIFYNVITRMNRRILYRANDIAHGLLGESMRPSMLANSKATPVEATGAKVTDSQVADGKV